MKTHSIAIVLLFLCTASITAFGQPWNAATARKWVKSRNWANGSKIRLNPSANEVEFATQYHTNKAWWDKAFVFLTDAKLDTLKPGRYALDGDNVFAIITDGPTKPADSVRWESHRNYIDLHYVISGRERIGVARVASAAVTQPYDVSRDAANYLADGRYYLASPGEFFLFFPSDAHRPGVKAKGYGADRKLVIKIRYTAINP